MEGTSTSGTGTAQATGGENAQAQSVGGRQTDNNEVNKAKETEGKEEAKEKSQRDLFYERHRKDYPDDDEKDEELFYKRHNERTAEYDRLKKSDTDFRKLVNEHPQYGAMFLDAMDGKDVMESILGRFSKDDIMAAFDDPEKSKSLSERYSRHVKDEEDARKLREEGDANVQDAVKRFTAYCSKNGIGDDETVDMWNQIVAFYEDGVRGKFSDRLFDMFRKASNYDGDVATARHEGELKGHNAKVQTQLAREKGPKGIPPTFDGGQGAAGKEPKPKDKKRVYNPFRHEWQEFDE